MRQEAEQLLNDMGNDPMRHVIFAGEAIADVLRHVQQTHDLVKMDKVTIPLARFAALQLALQGLTQYLHNDNQRIANGSQVRN